MRPFATVLVRPIRPANVGAAARALKNFGLADLRLVGTDVALPGSAGHAEARALAWGSADVLQGASSFGSVEAAVADLHLVAAADSSPGVPGEIVSPRELADEVARLPAGARAGCVFGPEDSGLTHAEQAACRLRLRIPTARDQPSLNLAQAVLVVAYEVGLADAVTTSFETQSIEEDTLPAREGEIDRLARAFRELGLDAGYLNAQAPEHVARELRALLARSRPTRREVTLLLGLAAQLRWAIRGRREP